MTSLSEKRAAMCPRLVDYLVIVGRANPGSNSPKQPHHASDDGGLANQLPSSSHVQPAEILRRYPPQTDEHSDFALSKDVSSFCQPEGCITYAGKRMMPTFRDTNSFVFSLTDKDSGKTRYGISINFYRTFGRLSVEAETEKTGNMLTPSAEQGRKKRHGRKVETYHTLTSLCLISHHPFFATFRQTIDVLRRLIDACNTRVGHLKKCGSNKSAKDAVWSVLSGQWTEKEMPIPAIIMHEIREVETWIWKLLSAPVPVPGKTRLGLQLLPLDILAPLTFALPDHTRFTLCDLPLHLPLELLGVDNVVKVLTCIMLEYKVVIQSRDYNALSLSVLALVGMLYPLEYMFPVIPLLPAVMDGAENLLLAPTPFIIGVPASFFKTRQILKVPEDVVLVDLDTNKIVLTEQTPYPELPEPEFSHLLNHLRQALNSMTTSRLSESASASTDMDACDIAARVAMVKFYDSPNVLANFPEHTRTLRLYPRPVVALQQESFLRSRPIKTDFILTLARTQAVEYFAECSLCPKNEAYLRVQTGTVDPKTIGDKPKWFSDQLVPVEFNVYTEGSTLATAWTAMTSADKLEANTDLHAKPLSKVDDVYHAPLTLEVPDDSDGDSQADSSLSSGRSSPSSYSTNALDSEADFARMAENLAVSPIAAGDAMAGSKIDWNTGVHVVNSSSTSNDADWPATTPTSSSNSKRSFTSLARLPSDRTNDVRGASSTAALTWGSKFNGVAERTEQMMTKYMMSRTSSSQQPLDTAGPSPAMTHTSKYRNKLRGHPSDQDSTEKAVLAAKSQAMVKDIVDAVIAGQGVAFFTLPKLKRLMEDENLRDLACTRLNLGLDIEHSSEEDSLPTLQLTRAQYKGYVKVLQACIQGIEAQYVAPGATGLASCLSVMEIAHTHYWAKPPEMSTATTLASLIGTPSSSMQDISKQLSVTSPIESGAQTAPTSPRPTTKPTNGPNRPPPPRQESITKNSKLAARSAEDVKKQQSVNGGRRSEDEVASPSMDAPLLDLPTPEEPEMAKTFIYQDLIVIQPGNLWCKMQFWEDVFYDAVAQEREIIGMDMEPHEMMDRYSSLTSTDRKRLEMDEDRLLSTLMHNMTAFMVMCGAPLRPVQQKIRRLLGKSHTGLVFSQRINVMLDTVARQSGNSIELKPVGSRLMQKQTFTVHQGSDSSGNMLFMEVCDDAIVVRLVTGAIDDRWWYERLVNMTYSPKTKVLCIWRKHDEQVQLHMFYTRKCRDLYNCIKGAMERAAARGKAPIPGRDLGGEFPIEDLDEQKKGQLQVRIDGLLMEFGEEKVFIELAKIKKCQTTAGNMFVLQQFDAKSNNMIDKRYKSEMASQIALAFHRVVSVHVHMRRIDQQGRHRRNSSSLGGNVHYVTMELPKLVPLIAQHLNN